MKHRFDKDSVWFVLVSFLKLVDAHELWLLNPLVEGSRIILESWMIRENNVDVTWVEDTQMLYANYFWFLWCRVCKEHFCLLRFQERLDVSFVVRLDWIRGAVRTLNFQDVNDSSKREKSHKVVILIGVDHTNSFNQHTPLYHLSGRWRKHMEQLPICVHCEEILISRQQ